MLPHRILSFLAPSQHMFEKWIVALRRASVTSMRVEDYYRIGRLIGEGMNGQVRLAHDLLTDEQVAVKMVPRLGRENETQFLAREVQIILSVAHPNIVRTVDVFVRSRKVHFVMEYLQGGELFDFIAENTHFTEVHAASVMADLLRALAYLHARGIAHRDVKLENLLCANITWPLNVKLADFGFANYVNAAGGPVLSSFVGTPYYIAPEMLRGNPHGCPVDVWASGVVMYILLSGKFPFGGKNESEYYHRVLTREAYFPNEEWSNMSSDAKNLVRGMLCKDPRRRLTAEECLRHPWLKRADTIPEEPLNGEVFPMDPTPDLATDSATFSTIDAGFADGGPDVPDVVMASSPAGGAVYYQKQPQSADAFSVKRIPSTDKQAFLRSPGVFRDNREKKGKWRYLGMLNHSLSGPTEVVLATRRTPEKKADKRADKKGSMIPAEAATRAPCVFEEVITEAPRPEETPVNRRPSLIRRLLSSGKLSLDRYDSRFPSFRGNMDEHADEATATPRKTYSLFSKDGPLRRSFHRGGENSRSQDDGINFVNSQSQRLPPKVARERQRQQRQAAEAFRKSARAGGAGGLFTHLKGNGGQYAGQHTGYHSSPRLQTPAASAQGVSTEGNAKGAQREARVAEEGESTGNVDRRRIRGADGPNAEAGRRGPRRVGETGHCGIFQARDALARTDDGTLRRTVSADVTPVDRLTGGGFGGGALFARFV